MPGRRHRDDPVRRGDRRVPLHRVRNLHRALRLGSDPTNSTSGRQDRSGFRNPERNSLMIPLERIENKVVEPRRDLPVDAEVDVLVAGGGMAGVGAAIAASRAGCRTLLIERESMLGGLATAGLVNI